MNRKELKSEFLKVYYQQQAGENQMLESWQHEILDKLLEPIFTSKDFTRMNTSEIESIFPSIGAKYREECVLYRQKNK